MCYNPGVSDLPDEFDIRNRKPRVIVAGGINLDLAGHADGPAPPGTSTPGKVTLSTGGVARNIAENLAAMGCSVELVGAVGEDLLSRFVLEKTAAAGVGVDAVRRDSESTVGVYLSILAAGELERAIADTGATERINGATLRSMLVPFRDSRVSLLVLDTNLYPEALQTALDWATEEEVPVLVEPVSVEKSLRLAGLRGRIDYVTPNEAEIRALLGASAPLPEIRHWVVTRGDRGAGLYRPDPGSGGARSGDTDDLLDESRWELIIPAEIVTAVNVNGAGDAFVAAFSTGIVTGRSLEESLRLGVRAGTLTVQSSSTVAGTLTLENLIDLA